MTYLQMRLDAPYGASDDFPLPGTLDPFDASPDASGASLRAMLEAAIDTAIAILDMLDGDSDLEPAGDEADYDVQDHPHDADAEGNMEPTMGSCENHPHAGYHGPHYVDGDQTRWARGYGSVDDGEPEPSLGSLNNASQSQWAWGDQNDYEQEITDEPHDEADEGGKEPSLGSPEHSIGNQEHWDDGFNNWTLDFEQELDGQDDDAEPNGDENDDDRAGLFDIDLGPWRDEPAPDYGPALSVKRKLAPYAECAR